MSGRVVADRRVPSADDKPLVLHVSAFAVYLLVLVMLIIAVDRFTQLAIGYAGFNARTIVNT